MFTVKGEATHVEKWERPRGPVAARLLILKCATTSGQNVAQSAVTEASLFFIQAC